MLNYKSSSIWYDLSYFIEVSPDSFLDLLFIDTETYKHQFIVTGGEDILGIPTFHESINFDMIKKDL